MILGLPAIGGLPDLMRQAWDATKLGLAIRAHRGERALVKAQANAVRRYTPKTAIAEIKRLYEGEHYEALTRCFLPDVVVDKGKDLVDFWWKVWDIYWIWVAVRVLVIFMPSNSGYIHPDQYFQSLEVTYGDVLDIETERTWEFNTTEPLRSQTIPYVLYGLPLTILKFFDFLIHFHTGLHFLGPFIIHLLPKLILLALSFTIDYTVYKICELYRHSFNQCLTTLASSYVVIIYSTRTFSNTLELLLTTQLVYYVALSMKRSDETVYLQEMIQKKYNKAETIREKVEIQKKRKVIPPHDFKYVVQLGLLCAIGTFNRPTFVLYAFAPLFYWFQRGVANHSLFSPFQIFNFRMLVMLPIFVAGCLVLILCDSLYFGDLTLHKLWHLTMKWSDWKVAPYNFIMYNAVPGNLAAHGTHPHYTHLLVNLPMLFGPLGPLFVVSCLNFILDAMYLPWRQKPGLRSVYALTLGCAVIPLVGLSIFKHQEPRFLLPLLPCIVLMCSHKLRWKCYGYRPLLTLWYLFNVLGLLWFGFIHQAGVMPVQQHIGGLKQGDTQYVNLVYGYTYMPPRYPLMQPKSLLKAGPDPGESSEEWKARLEAQLNQLPGYVVNPYTKYIVKDFGSIEMDTLHTRLLDLVSRSEYISKKQGKPIKTYLILPTFLMKHLKAISRNSLVVEDLYLTAPHVSVESLHMMDVHIWDSLGKITPQSIIIGALNMFSHLSLSVANVTLGPDVSTVNVPEDIARHIINRQ